MSVVDLSDEDTVAILAETFTESLSSIEDKTRKVAVLKRLHELLLSSAPQHYIYEAISGCDELQVIRVGRDQRVYCRLVMGIPHRNTQHNVLFVFYGDPHEYRSSKLATFDEAARQRMREVTSFDSVDSVEVYLDDMNAFTAADIKDRIDRLHG